MDKPALDLDKIRARLESAQGPLYWKSLEELAETKEFQAFLDDELADRTPNWLDPAHRRNFSEAGSRIAGICRHYGLHQATQRSRSSLMFANRKSSFPAFHSITRRRCRWAA